MLLSCAQLSAEDNRWGVDSTLFEYYKRCQNLRNNRELLLVSDTLFNLAGSKGDVRMQCVALTAKVRYYSTDITASHEQVSEAVNYAMSFAKKAGMMRYYYQAWTYFINRYVNRKQYNLARIEIYKMFDEVQRNPEEEQMIIECYKLISTLYDLEGEYDEAYRNARMAVDKTIELRADTFNISTRYSNAIRLACKTGDFAYAQNTLPLCKRSIVYESQIGGYVVAKINVWTGLKMPVDEIKRELECLDTLKASQLSVTQRMECERMCYEYFGEWEKVLDILLQQLNSNSTPISGRFYRKLAIVYNNLGRYKEAAHYFEMADSLRREHNKTRTSNSLEEFSVMMNVAELNARNSQLEQSIRSREIRFAYFSLVALMLLLVILFVYTFKTRSQNDFLTNKNDELLIVQEQLEREKRIAEKASRMKSSFVRNICHEVRTPMNAIYGFSEILAEKATDPEDKQLTEIVLSNSRDLLAIITDMIDVADLESSVDNAETQPFDVVSLCHEVIDQMPQKPQEGVVVQLESESAAIEAVSDPHCVSLILQHTLTNAYKFTSKGNIVVSVATFGGNNDSKPNDDYEAIGDATDDLGGSETIVITVQDTGIGIPPDKREWVFERFAKIDRFSKGTGLGLSICRLAAAKIHGTVSIDSFYTNGCRVRFSFERRWVRGKEPEIT